MDDYVRSNLTSILDRTSIEHISSQRICIFKHIIEKYNDNGDIDNDIDATIQWISKLHADEQVFYPSTPCPTIPPIYFFQYHDSHKYSSTSKGIMIVSNTAVASILFTRLQPDERRSLKRPFDVNVQSCRSTQTKEIFYEKTQVNGVNEVNEVNEARQRLNL